MKSKKIMSLFLTGLIISIAFTGCGNTKTAENGTQNIAVTDETSLKGEIEMWSTFTDKENAVLTDKVIPAFNKKYPDIKVKITPMPGGDDYKKQILQAAMSGTTPDLARTDIVDVAQYASQDYLAAVDGMPGFEDLKKETFEGPMGTNMYNGHYYGIPLDTNTKVAIYNKTMLNKAGLKEAPKTMEELQKYAEKLQAGNVNGIGIAGLESWAIAPYFMSLGGKFTDDKNTKATGYLNSPESVKALEKIIEWNDKGYIGASLLGGEGSWEGFNAEHYGMIDDGPWWFPANKDQDTVKDNVVFAQMPKGAGGSVSVVGGEDTIVFKSSKNQQQAYVFAKYLASDEAQTIFATELAMMPVSKITAEKSVIKDNKMLSVYMNQLSSTWARTPSPKWGDISNAIRDEFESAVRKDKTAKQALDDAASKVDVLLQEK
ncbi:MAG: extracellular solute-binding protein [Clostridium beijerinckii]|jgi:multiple sugar transport system substrate-binding protein|nr:extracellular solute-binding protein [Clostridium beijerinckii]MCI1579537.1 extracellular solute-binding protein [Clostridium beijerinckii]MCI1585321.1 extracellular solute-binding protein [Clostridium beijerinckii]MCI1622144.1 extracellular solute-binding protein [Clostridium beijerinckii]